MDKSEVGFWVVVIGFFSLSVLGSILLPQLYERAYGATPNIPITVPSAPGAGHTLISTTTGAYVYATATNPVFITQSGHGFVVKNIIRMAYDGRYHKATGGGTLADGDVAGMVSRVIDANTFVLTTNGYVTGLSGFATGTTWYLTESTSTPGVLASTTPKLSGSVVKPLFIADSPTSGYFYNFRGNVQQYHAGLPSQTNIRYNPDNSQIIHFYNPTDYGCATTTGLKPVVAFFHGGGQDTGPTDADLTVTIEPMKTMLKQCIALVGVQYVDTGTYPITGTGPYSVQQDAGRVFQYLRANWREFNINPNWVGGFGISAGSIILQNLSYGPDLRSMNAASNTQQFGFSTKPDFFFQNKGISHWPDLDQTYNLTQSGSNIIFGIAGALSNVPGATQIAYSGTTLVEGAVARGEVIVPTYHICADYPTTSPPVVDPHDEYFCEKLAAKIESYGYPSPSPSLGVPTTEAETQVLIDWMWSVLSHSSHLSEFINQDSPQEWDAVNTFTQGIVVNGASSTITNVKVTNATTTNATTTGIHLLDGGFISRASSTLMGVTRASSIFRAGSDTLYAQFFNGDLTFLGGRYLVGSDRDAFTAAQFPLAGLRFSVADTRFIFKNIVGATTTAFSAVAGVSNYILENTSIGTTTSSGSLYVGPDAREDPLTISTTSPVTASSTLFKVDSGGWVHYGGGTPTLSSCGTGPTLDGNSTDQAGTVTFGATAIGCTITFSSPAPTSPHCQVTPRAISLVNAYTVAPTTASIVITQAASGGTVWDYFCPLGH